MYFVNYLFSQYHSPLIHTSFSQGRLQQLAAYCILNNSAAPDEMKEITSECVPPVNNEVYVLCLFSFSQCCLFSLCTTLHPLSILSLCSQCCLTMLFVCGGIYLFLFSIPNTPCKPTITTTSSSSTQKPPPFTCPNCICETCFADKVKNFPKKTESFYLSEVDYLNKPIHYYPLTKTLSTIGTSKFDNIDLDERWGYTMHASILREGNQVCKSTVSYLFFTMSSS